MIIAGRAVTNDWRLVTAKDFHHLEHRVHRGKSV